MHILVIRVSSMGDVALTVPVIRAFRGKYPDTEISVLTRSDFSEFFSSVKGVNIFTPDFSGRHKGFNGILRLYRDLKGTWKTDRVIDLHDVLRSQVLRCLFWFGGAEVSVIKKGRREKQDLVKGRDKRPLKHTIERYCEAFTRAGYPVVPEWKTRQLVAQAHDEEKAGELLSDERTFHLGVAPYAKHMLKMWPEENMISLLKKIATVRKTKIWLFGGVDEKDRLDKLSSRLDSCTNLSGELSLGEEIAVMGRLDLMIAMDSSNMHMAALAGTKVVSIWGGTDPLAGFGAWMQPEEYAVRIPKDELECRPCTVYGKGKCRRSDLACLKWLSPDMVFNEIAKTGILGLKAG